MDYRKQSPMIIELVLDPVLHIVSEYYVLVYMYVDRIFHAVKSIVLNNNLKYQYKFSFQVSCFHDLQWDRMNPRWPNTANQHVCFIKDYI